MTPEQARLFEIFHPHAAAQQDKRFLPGMRFVHYTSAEKAMLILQSKEIWMRKSMCMNDYSEVSYGLHCLLEAYHKHDVGRRFKEVLDRLFEGLGPDVAKQFDSWTRQLLTNTYLTCVSEHDKKDDIFGRLSMWRAYGATDGIALVFNNAAFQSEPAADVLKIFGSPIAYFEPDLFTAKFGEVVANIERAEDFLRRQGRQEIQNRVFRMLAFAVLATKHPAFLEEREWRVIHCPWWQPSDHIKPQPALVRGVPQLVCKIPLKDIPEKGLFGLTIPALIERIMIGPTQYPDSMREAFVEVLKREGVEQADSKVFRSNIPLRI